MYACWGWPRKVGFFSADGAEDVAEAELDVGGGEAKVAGPAYPPQTGNLSGGERGVGRGGKPGKAGLPGPL
jgi:hypothetical protein